MPPRPPASHLAKVPARIASAITGIRDGNWEPAVGSLYYACFHVALALLSTGGASPASHRGVRELFALQFVVDGPLPRDAGRIFAQLMTARELADYSVAGETDAVAAIDAAGKALEFLQAALPVLAERAPETAAALPDLAPLRTLIATYTAST